MALSNTTTQTLFRILTWNTLEYNGAWPNGWGCPLEIQRRDEWRDLHPESSVEEAQHFLTMERYQRIQQVMTKELDSMDLDLIFFQEISRSQPSWTDEWEYYTSDTSVSPSSSDDITSNSRSKKKKKKSSSNSLRGSTSSSRLTGYQEIPCQDKYSNTSTSSTYQQIFMKQSENLKYVQHHDLENTTLLEGGCLVELSWQKQSFYIVNLHAQASIIRNPSTRTEALLNFQTELFQHIEEDQADRVILCGDWNAHLVELEQEWTLLQDVLPVMLDNTTTSPPIFSTNHEAGFLAQYDGCFVPLALLSNATTSTNLTGFMPKGKNGELTGLFSAFDLHKTVEYNQTVLPHTEPSTGMSDHLRVYTEFRIQDLF